MIKMNVADGSKTLNRVHGVDALLSQITSLEANTIWLKTMLMDVSVQIFQSAENAWLSIPLQFLS
jgi:hypothetical protein